MGATLRVAVVAPFGLRPKGTTISRALPIAQVLASQGARVRLVIPPWDDPTRAGERGVDGGVEVVHTRLGRPLTGPPLMLADLIRHVHDFKPNVVHVFKPIGYSGATALWFGRGKRSPRVVVDADDLEGPAGWAGRKRLGIRGRIRGIQERIVLRKATRVTVASHWLGGYVESLGVSPRHILYLPNGYTPSVFAPRPDDRGHGEPGACTRLLWYTRFTEVSPVRAASMLAPLLVGPSAPRLAILGEEVNPGDRDALNAALAEAGVGAKIDWLGYDAAMLDRFAHDNPQSVAIYPLDDNMVNRARCPAKVAQLMGLGIPIVAEAVGELNHYLEGFENQCLAPAGDQVAFRSRVTALVESQEARTALAGRLVDAAERWTWERTGATLLDWYFG